jgi:hypothetical protein
VRLECATSLLLIAGTLTVAAAQQSVQMKKPELTAGVCHAGMKLDNTQIFQNYRTSIYRNYDDDGCIEIYRDGHLVFSRKGGVFYIGNSVNAGDTLDDGSKIPVIPIGTDLTGRGKPDIILNEWSGGAHCCYQFHVVELGDTVRRIATIDAEDSDYAHFDDLDRKGIYEFFGWDFTFSYWHTSFAGSPAPEIILRFNGKNYALANAQMEKPLPSREALIETQTQIRSAEWKNNFPPPLLWETMLNLIYTGHSGVARGLLDDAWVPGHIQKNTFIAEFCNRLSESPYARQLSDISTFGCPRSTTTPTIKHRLMPHSSR